MEIYDFYKQRYISLVRKVSSLNYKNMETKNHFIFDIQETYPVQVKQVI